MNRTIVAASAALLAIALPTAAGATAKKKPAPKKPVRHTLVLKYAYSGTESVHGIGQGCVYAQVMSEPPPPCFDVNPPSWARYMTIASADATGRPTPISLFDQTTGVNPNGSETYVCGSKHDSPVAAGDAWTLSVDLVSADPTCPGPATTGTVTITLSNLP